MDQVEVAGLRVAFERAGRGPTLVLVHGGVCDGRVCDGRVWRRQLDGLSDEFTVVAWDAPGCGRSSDPPESFRLPDYADVLAGLIAALDLGASSCARAFLRRRFGFGAVPPASGSPCDADLGRRLCRMGRLALSERGRPTLAVRSRRGRPVAWAIRAKLDAGTVLAGDARGDGQRARKIMSDVRPVGTRAMARALAEADLRDVLPSIDVPTHLLYGELDERSSLKVAQDLYGGIRASRFVVMAGLGHECYLESPERFNAEVRGFLRSVA
jgi:pimeloyl-ACP methyl ester carboxylesterase